MHAPKRELLVRMKPRFGLWGLGFGHRGHWTFTLLLLLVLVLGLSSMVWARIMLISRSTEIEIGREVARELERQYGVWNDPEQTRRVEIIGKSIVAICDRKDMPYTFKILDTKEINAMAAPGGFIYVTRGLLKVVESDDELAFVLAHEVGHVVGQHARKMISDAMVGDLVLGIFLGGASRTIQTAANIMFGIWQRGYSRKQEYAADSYGLRYMMAIGYEPTAAITMLQKLGNKKYKGLNKIFATHPAVPDRINRLANVLKVDPKTLEPLPGSSLSASPTETGKVEGEEGGETPKVWLTFVSGGKIWLTDLENKHQEELWLLMHKTIEWYDWAADGSKLLVAYREGDSDYIHIAAVTQGGDQVSNVATISWIRFRKPHLALSTDGRWLAAVALDRGKARLVLISTDGQEQSALGDRMPMGEITSPIWLPDGRIAFLTTRGAGSDSDTAVIGIANMDGTTRLLEELDGAEPGFSPQCLAAVSPDGRYLLLLGRSRRHEDEMALYAIDAQNQRLTLIAENVEKAVWGGDGKVIALVRVASGAKTVRSLLVARLGAESPKDGKQIRRAVSKAHLVGRIEGEYDQPDISPDGSQIAFAFRLSGQSTWQVWTATLSVNAKPTQIRQVQKDASQPQFAPVNVNK